jgi:hypothetical protein
LATLLLAGTLALAKLIAACLLTSALSLPLLLSALLAALTLLTLALLPLALLALLSLALLALALLSLALLALLTATLLLTLALLALLTALALLTLPLLVPARGALQLLSQLLDLVQRLLDSGLRLAFVSRLPHRLFGLVELIPERLQSHGHRILPRPDVSAKSASEPIGSKLHSQLQLVLLHLAESFTNLSRGRTLRPGHVASSTLHLAFESVQIVQHLFLLASEFLALASILPRRRTSLSALLTVRLFQLVYKFTLLPRKIISLLRELVQFLTRLLLAHPTDRIASFLQTICRSPSFCRARLRLRCL